MLARHGGSRPCAGVLVPPRPRRRDAAFNVAFASVFRVSESHASA